jgi:hypothetical protein
MAKEAVLVVVGARPVEWQKRIVRNRHTGKLHEIDMHELPPVDKGDDGTTYVFARARSCPQTIRPSSTVPPPSSRPSTEPSLRKMYGLEKMLRCAEERANLAEAAAEDAADSARRCSHVPTRPLVGTPSRRRRRT